MGVDQFQAGQIASAEFLIERVRIRQFGSSKTPDRFDFLSWKQLFDSAGPGLFTKRLASIGLSESEAQAVTDSFPTTREPIPDWWNVLHLALNSRAASIDSAGDQPFSRLWLPLVGYAQSEVFGPSTEHALLRPQAIQELSAFLLEEICRIAAESLYLMFSERRSQHSSFQEFIDFILENQHAALFCRFPALARCISLLLTDWIRGTKSFLKRLVEDLPLISARITNLGSEPKVASVRPGLSDRHEEGAQAILLSFSNGNKILYKPKDMSLEAVVPSINSWLEYEGCPIRFKFPRSISKGSYGWSEFVEQRPCSSLEEVRSYYFQSGALLCLAHLLNAKDLLFENLVAFGPDPVPIDLEAFFQPEVRTFHKMGLELMEDAPEYKWEGSVIDTGLLPIWHISTAHPICDLSGLGGTGMESLGTSRLVWEKINSDEMKAYYEPSAKPAANNQVFLNGRLQRPQDFETELARGFGQLHDFILSKKESFLQFVDSFSGAKSRLVLRPTQVYGLLIKRSLEPQNLSTGVRRNIVLEQLYRPALKGDYLTPYVQQLFDFEVEALLELDIPRFYINVDSEDLELTHSRRIPRFLWESPLKTVKRRVADLSPRVKQFNLEIVRESLTRKPDISTMNLSTGVLRALAVQHADQILEQTELDSPANLWRLPTYYRQEPPRLEREGIYSGDLGVLIFLASVDCATGQDRASALLDHARKRLASFQLHAADPLGICNGIGSLIYGSSLLAKLTAEPGWLENAVRLADALPEEAIRSHPEPDLLYGLAGLLLALTRLYAVVQDQWILQKAASCLEVLQRTFQPGIGWRRPDGEPQLGFAHGSAGIAFAAAEYSKVSENAAGLEVVRNAFAFDRPFYSNVSHNWPTTTAKRRNPVRAWCNGLPGMTLARIGASTVSQDPELNTEIDRSLERFPGLVGMDHWCCGNFGNAEILMYASEALGRQDLWTIALKLASDAVHRARKNVYSTFSPELGQNYCFQPSLFRGSSGLGYTLLRLTNPKLHPSIVAFEL